MPDYKLDWTIFIFCFNEEKTIGHVVDRAVSVSKSLSEASEVLVINDGSTDNSKKIIDSKCTEHKNVRAFHHEQNKGIGEALITGYSNARGSLVCGIPADGQFDSHELLPFKEMEQGNVICFVRRQKYSSRYRSFLSGFNNYANRLLLNLSIMDVNWVKIYHINDLRVLRIKMRSSLVESEICALLKARGVKFQEVYSTYHNRVAGQSKGGSFSTVLSAALEFGKLVWRVTLFRLGFN